MVVVLAVVVSAWIDDQRPSERGEVSAHRVDMGGERRWSPWQAKKTLRAFRDQSVRMAPLGARWLIYNRLDVGILVRLPMSRANAPDQGCARHFRHSLSAASRPASRTAIAQRRPAIECQAAIQRRRDRPRSVRIPMDAARRPTPGPNSRRPTQRSS
jgi:hypothetical protein